MAFTDALLNFVAPGSPLSIVGADGVDIPSPNIIDLMGNGVGTAPTNILGNVTLAGSAGAMGVGRQRLELLVMVGTAFTTGNAATMKPALQLAADSGVGGSYQPGTWRTIAETGALTAAQCTAGTVIMRLPWLPPFPENLRPRFVRILFQITASTHFTAGTIAVATCTPDRYDPFNKYAANNYAVA